MLTCRYNRVSFISISVVRLLAGLSLLLPTAQPTIDVHSKHFDVTNIAAIVDMVSPKVNKPDYDRDVLIPLRKAQMAKAIKDAEDKARADALAAAETARKAEAQRLATIAVPNVPAASSESTDAIRSIIIAAANSHGMNADAMLRIAKCESGYNPLARNPNYTVPGYGNPVGLFQHIEGYWPARAARYGYPGASVFDPVANANVTAAMMVAEGVGAWECK